MGCLKKIIKIFILALAIVGFISIGGKDYIVNFMSKNMEFLHEDVLEKASKLGDFSALSEEFEIDKAASILGYSGVLAEHSATGQKILIVDSDKKPMLTEEDISSSLLEDKLITLSKKYKYQPIKIDDITVTKTGSMKAYGKKVPYAKFSAKVKNLPIGEINGIISCIKIEEDSRLLISINEKDKYSQLVTEEFFKSIKP